MKEKKTLNMATAGFIFNALFGIYNGFLGITNQSWWLITASAYYILLSIMRFGSLNAAKKAGTSDYIMRFTGCMFVAMSIILAGTAYLSAETDQGIRFNEIVMITIALYTFSKITLAIVNLAKSSEYSAAAFRTLRNISFADALVSVFSLQRSMLVTFPGLTAAEIRLFNMLTGSGVYISVFILGLNLIGGKRIEMAKSKLVKANEKIAETVVGTYKKIEQGVTGGYTKIEDKFVDQFLTREGETVEEAKERLKK